MIFAKTTVRCPDKRFRTRRYAKRWAWGLEPDRSRRMVPYRCERCDAFHLAPPEATPTTMQQES